ncbi:BlyB family putative holin accessory protein [Borreliella garinii]|uniref:BlyB family putative holin accessory protein n=1 Tax=Borreliella garinii TaxID=29519 RepID=UPI00292DB756|nr:BlyB family putative holin accessory protein [Borreliella garinii]WNZ74080.1 BlyB family putative holin accessory protein [Borreliella garinii]WNZ75051.1 BlyB family putative holin accessory protein [Borreliella garinii]
MKLSKDNVELGLTSLSNLIDIFSKFEDEFDEMAHKGFFLIYELYSHYKLIYTANIERLENILTPTITKTFAPINKKINQCIDLVNFDEKNLKFNKEKKSIYQEVANNAK